MRQHGISLTPTTRAAVPAKYRLGTLLECPQMAMRFTVVGTPADCEYLPTGERVYLCCEDTLDRKILVMPAAQVETDLVEVINNPIRDRRLPGLDRRSADRRTSNGTRREND